MTLCRWLMTLPLSLLIQLGGLPSVAHGSGVPSVDEIIQKEKRLIESRKAIRSGRVVVRTRLTKFAQNPSQANVDKRFFTYFQGDNIRCDYEVGKHRSQMVFTPDTHIRCFSDARTVLVFGPNTRRKDMHEVPDPRRLGIVAWFYDSINNWGYEEVFLNPNRDQFKIEPGTERGDPIWKVSFRLPGKPGRARFGEYWLSQDSGGLPVYIRIRAGEGEDESLRSIAMKLKEYPGHVWFPSEVVFRLATGSQVTAEEIVTVQDATFVNDVSEQTFTLAGLGLPKGKLVDLDGKVMTWNGDRLVREYAEGEAVGEIPPISRGRLLLVLGSIVLALVAAFLWRERAKRRQPR